MKLINVIFKFGRGVSKFTGAILGAALVPAYNLINTAFGLVYIVAVTPFALLAHLRAKYLNRRFEGQSIIRAALSTLIISPIGFALKFALFAVPMAIGVAFGLLGTIGLVFKGIARGLKYGLLAVLNPFFKKDVVDGLREQHPFIDNQYNKLEELKALKTRLEANPNRTAQQQRELNLIKSKIKKMNAMLNPSLFQSLVNTTKALFIVLAPNRLPEVDGNPRFMVWLMTTVPRALEALGINNEAISEIFAGDSNNLNQTGKRELIDKMNVLTPGRHITKLSPEEEALLSIETDANIVKLYNDYKKIIEGNTCPISLNTLSEITNPITIKRTHYSENSKSNKATYVTYEFDDFIEYLEQPNTLLQTTDRTSLILSDISNNSVAISGKNADGYLIEIFKGVSLDTHNEIEKLSEQLKQHLNKRKNSTSSTKDMQATLGTKPVSSTSTTVAPELSTSSITSPPYAAPAPSNDDECSLKETAIPQSRSFSARS